MRLLTGHVAGIFGRRRHKSAAEFRTTAAAFGLLNFGFSLSFLRPACICGRKSFYYLNSENCEKFLRFSRPSVSNPNFEKCNKSVMSEDLIFMMGKYEARIPTDRLYAPNHLWLKPTQDGQQSPYRVGFTAYSVRMLQDVYFLEWHIDPHTAVTDKQEIGEIESSKALSSLHTPFAGQLLEFNEGLLDDPSAINADNYGGGWLFELDTDAELLTPEQYLERLEAGWEKDQRLIKGQIQ